MSSGLLSSSSYSTKSVAEQDRFEAFRQYMSPLADLEPLSGPVSTDVFDLKAWEMGELMFVREVNPGAKFTRSKRRVRTSPNDHYYLYIITRGDNFLLSDRGRGTERRSHATAGSVALHSMIDVNRGFMRNIECQMVFLPRDSFGAATRVLDDNTNKVFTGPVGRLVLEFINATNREVECMTKAQGEVFSRALIELLKASLGPSETPSIDRNILDHVGKARIRHYILMNLSDPTLSPARICQDAGISRASLYRLFEPEGGVANYILACRLAQASKLIRNPGELKNINQIAHSLGFRSSAELSRSFKRSFEISPRELMALQGSAQGEGKNVDFSRVLNSLV